MKSTAKNSDKLIVALDTASLEVAEELLKDLQGVVSFYKVGFELFTAHGWKAVKLVQKYGGKVFLDLKLHDIPNTVAKTISVVCKYKVDIVNVHAQGGLEMMKKVREAVDQAIPAGKPRPLVIAVTVLTSLTDTILSQELGISRDLEDQVLELAKLVKKAGLDGVVSSPQEITLLRNEFPKNFIIVTPGVRPKGSDQGDQKRVCQPKEAIKAGADYIVVGRPITAAPNPKEAALEILRGIQP